MIAPRSSLSVALIALLAGCQTMPKPAMVTDAGMVNHSGGSMLPAFPVKCRVRVEPVPFLQLQEGETVAYWNVWAGCVVNHRLVKHTKRGWLVKGDNNRKLDPGLVTASDYYGVTKLEGAR